MDESVSNRQARLETLLESLVSRLDERCSVRKETQDDHGERLTKLESIVNQAKGGWIMLLLMLSAASVLGGGVAVLIMNFLDRGVKG